jgi:hypothetical protein
LNFFHLLPSGYKKTDLNRLLTGTARQIETIYHPPVKLRFFITKPHQDVIHRSGSAPKKIFLFFKMTVLYYHPMTQSTKFRLHKYTVHDTWDSIPKRYVTVQTTLQQAPRILHLTDTYFLVHLLSIPINQNRIDEVIMNTGNSSLDAQPFLLKTF